MNLLAASVSVSPNAVVLGALIGLGYGVLAAGLILVYRSTGILNFAHGDIGAFGAAVLAKVVLDNAVPFVPALLLAIAIGAVVGVAVDGFVVRRLSNAPRVVTLAATVGVSQLLLAARAIIPDVEKVSSFPTPLDRALSLGSLLLRSEHFVALAVIPAAVVALSLFLERTPQGLAIRSVADNPDAAELSGISTRRTTMVVWALAGGLAALSAVVIAPLRGEQVGQLDASALGAGLLLRSLAAGLCGRLRSLPLALGGGVAIGVIEATLLFNGVQPSLVEAVLFVAVLALVLFRTSGDDRDRDELVRFDTPRPLVVPGSLRSPWLRGLPRLAWVAVAVVAVVLPPVIGSSGAVFRLTEMVVYAIVGISVVVLTGWAGHLSLGQFALAGIGAFVSAAAMERGVPFAIAVLHGVIAGIVIAVVIGLPALRVRGLLLAITTLAFALTAREFIFTSAPFVGGDGDVTAHRPVLGPLDFSGPIAYYYLCLAVLGAVALSAARLRATGSGRTIIAVRDNDRRAAAVAVGTTRARLEAFAVAGGMAALAGGLYAGLLVTFGPQTFGVEESVRVVSLAIIGGVASVGGAVLGAVYLLGVPALFGNTAVSVLLTSGVGILVLLLYLPGGLVSIARSLGQLALDRLARGPAGAEASRGETAEDATDASGQATLEGARVRPRSLRPVVRPHSGAAGDAPALDLSGVTVEIAGRTIVQAVDLAVRRGEILGLIGPNGAGKSTLLNVASGFVEPSAGTVRLRGEDITLDPPHVRAAAGLGRVFQDGRLFGDLTVRECVAVALEARTRSELVPDMLGLSPSRLLESRRSRQASELIDYLGLGRYADTTAGKLSTGTRRIVEVACLLAQRADMLVLDEPTAGLAQRETEAFAPLLDRVRNDLGASVLIVEHDMPLVLSVSDRVQCLAGGVTLATGTPEEIRSDDAVIAAYLGRRDRAVTG